MAVLGSCCNACFYAPPAASFGTSPFFSSQVSHYLHHAFHFCCIRALRQWRRAACRSDHDTASARLSVLCATSAAKAFREKALLLSRKTRAARNFQIFENSFSSMLESLMTPAQGLPSQPSRNCCSPFLMGETKIASTIRRYPILLTIVVPVLLSLLIHPSFSRFITLKYRIVHALIRPSIPPGSRE